MSNDTAPELAAYISGRTAWAWCEHEQRWHRHGLAGGIRSAECACMASPYRETGYRLRDAGPLTPAVLAGRTEVPACMECSAAGECSCGEPVCDGSYYYCGTRCARHAHDECGGCWRVHGGPGYGACLMHGIMAMHVHRYSTQCDVPYLAPAGEDYQPPCELAGEIARWWPEPGQAAGVHVHCPVCAAMAVVRQVEAAALARTWGLADTASRRQPMCPGCRRLITPAWAAALQRDSRRLEMAA